MPYTITTDGRRERHDHAGPDRRPSPRAVTSPSRSQPSAGYYVETLKIDGTAVQPAKSYTFKNVTRRTTPSRRPSPARPRCAPSPTTVVGGHGGCVRAGLPGLHAAPDRQRHLLLRSGRRLPHRLGPVNGWPVTAGSTTTRTRSQRRPEHHVLGEVRPPTQWTITASVTGKGTISPTGAKAVSEGDDVTYTFTPDAGNKLSDVLVDGQSVGIPSSYTFDDVTANHTIQAKFVTDSVELHDHAERHGGPAASILPATAFTVASSANFTVYFWPDDGYMVGTVTVDGTAVDASTWNDDDSYTFANVTANHTIAVAFVQVVPSPRTPSRRPPASMARSLRPTPQTVNVGDRHHLHDHARRRLSRRRRPRQRPVGGRCGRPTRSPTSPPTRRSPRPSPGPSCRRAPRSRRAPGRSGSTGYVKLTATRHGRHLHQR